MPMQPFEEPQQQYPYIQAPSIKELLETNFPPDTASYFHFILTSPDFPMTNLDLRTIIREEYLFKIAVFEYTFSVPPPQSIWKCSMEGAPKVTYEQLRLLHLLEMWFIARLRRSIDGFERNAQITQMKISRSEATPIMPPRRSWVNRFVGGNR